MFYLELKYRRNRHLKSRNKSLGTYFVGSGRMFRSSTPFSADRVS